MKAVVFRDVGDIRLEEVPEPAIQDPTDAIVRITESAICGTDLHFVRGTMPGVKSKGEFSLVEAKPLGEEPELGAAPRELRVQVEEAEGEGMMRHLADRAKSAVRTE